MTRINLIDPIVLTDQHLLAEWREIKMVPASLRRSLKSTSPDDLLKRIPTRFVLGKGHVTFFYDKLGYLADRYDLLTTELINRNFSLYHKGSFLDFCTGLPLDFFQNYVPDAIALELITKRIDSRIQQKPQWYKYYGNSHKIDT